MKPHTTHPPGNPPGKLCLTKRKQSLGGKWERNVIISEWLQTSAQRPELYSVGLLQELIRTSGICSTFTAQKCNFTLSHTLSPSPTKKKEKKKKKSIIKALISRQQHWPGEAKRSKFPRHELKTVWQVYRACVNLTSEQKYLLPAGASPFFFFFPAYTWKLEVAMKNSCSSMLQTYPWRILNICRLEQTLMVNMKNYVSEMLSSREENVCWESSENFS